MVVVEFDYEDFKNIFQIEREKVMEGLTEIGAPVEEDEETGKLFVEVTPNRPDWYSVIGLARAMKSYYKKEVKKYAVERGDWKVIVDKKVEGVRPYTLNAVITGLKLNDLMIRDMVLLQEKLLATLGRRVKRFGIGMYPLDKIKFPVRYTTMKPKDIIYQPLNYPKKADAVEILEKHPKGTEYGHIIKDSKEFPVYVDADGAIMALIPIVNSEETGKVDESTKNIFIEVSGNDMVGVSQALNVLVCHFIDLGGTARDVEVVYPDKKVRSPDLSYKKVALDEKNVKKILGTEPKEDMKIMLQKMGYLVENGRAFVQPYRTDILSDIDIIEDLAIVHGYNNFEPTVPDFFYPGKKSRGYRGLNDVMKRLGFVEICTPVLTSEDKLGMFGYGGMAVLNPKTREYTVIRSSILPNMVEVLAKNRMRGLPQKFYETGKVVGRTEEHVLCFALVDRALEFSTVRGHLQTIMCGLGCSFELKEKEMPFFEAPYSAEIVSGGRRAGLIGKISKKITQGFGFEFPVYICEITL